MRQRCRIGLLTPSSNTVMEPRSAEILAGLEDVSVHFARFRVLEISLGEKALSQFDFKPQLAAAEQLADAKVDVIAWGGTSGGWVGPETDRALCSRITERTGIPATTATLALLSAFRAFGTKDYALVTPYLGEVQNLIVNNFAKEGFGCTIERHLEDRGNFSFAQYDEETISGMVREVAAERPGVIAIYCTNFDGPRIAPVLERETGIPVIDSISVTLWHAMSLAGAEPSRLGDWGRLFSQNLPEEGGDQALRTRPASLPAATGK